MSLELDIAWVLALVVKEMINLLENGGKPEQNRFGAVFLQEGLGIGGGWGIVEGGQKAIAIVFDTIGTDFLTIEARI